MTRLDRRTCLKWLGGAVAGATVLPRPGRSWAETVGTSVDQVGLFLGLSSVLTGIPPAGLDVALALEYMDRLEDRAPGVLPVLLAEFAGAEHDADGDPAKLIELVETRIWKPECPQVSIGGDELCDLAAAPVCCLARDVPLLWYTSALKVTTDLEVPATEFEYGSPASYLGALAWKVGEAHPQGQCGGTYGYWSTRPGATHGTSG